MNPNSLISGTSQAIWSKLKGHNLSLIHIWGTSYKMYIAVQDELTAAYNEIRDIKAMEKWGKKYSELTEEQMDAVRKLVPTAISEAEPKNIGKGGKK